MGQAIFNPTRLCPTDEAWAWQLLARCRHADPDLFFHCDGDDKQSREHKHRLAKSICTSCPVKIDCVSHAVRFKERFGIWGGLSEAERKILLD